MSKLKIALVSYQSKPGEVKANLEGMKIWCQKAKQAGAEIVCFPEMAITGVINDNVVSIMNWRGTDALRFAETVPGKSTTELVSVAKELDTVIMTGIVEADSDHYYNCYAIISPDGLIGKHRKTHLPPVESNLLTEANEFPVFPLKNGWNVAINIGYEIWLPEPSRIAALRGAHLIITPSASGPQDPVVWKKNRMRYLPARSFENGVFVAAVNSSGAIVGPNGVEHHSGALLIMDPMGNLLAQSEEVDSSDNSVKMLVQDLDMRQLEAARGNPMYPLGSHRRPSLYSAISA